MSLDGAAGRRSDLDLVVLNLDGALGNISIRRLAGDMLALLNHGKLLPGFNGLDLVPGHGHIAGDVAVERHAAVDLAQQLAGELVAVGEDDDIRCRRRGSGQLVPAPAAAKPRPRAADSNRRKWLGSREKTRLANLN